MRTFSNLVWIFLFAALVAAVGFESLTASQQIPTHQHGDGSEAAKQDTKPPSPTLNQPHATVETSKREDKQAQAARHLKEFSVEFFNLKLSDVIIALFTIVLAVKTSGLFAETGRLREATDKLYAAGERQLDLLERTSAAQSRDMQASIAVADKAATAAAAQAQIIVKTERPYIFIIPLNEGGSPFDPERKVSYFIRNYGRTPGIVETVSIGLWIIFDFNAPPDYPALFKGEMRMVIAPETSPERDRLPSEYNKRKPFKPEELAAVARGDAKMCLIGRVEYRSIHDQILTTGFCFESVFGQGSWNTVGGAKYNYET